jgi:hypothetical protein
MEQVAWNHEEWKGAWDPFVRLAYQFGMMLGVDEFQQEQGYHLTKRRLSLRLFVGYGLVWGGAVSARVNGDATTLTVSPLLALDELGRELWLKGPCTLDLAQWSEENGLGDGTPAYLTVRYRPCSAAPVPAVAAACDESALPTMPSRVLEDAECELRLDAPEPPLDLAGNASPMQGDTQSSRFATLVDLIRNDVSRPLLLGTLVRSTGSDGAHQWSFTSNPLLPQLRMAAGPAAFRVIRAQVAGDRLEVQFTLPLLSAPTSAFRVDELKASKEQAAQPSSVVDESKRPELAGDRKSLEVFLKKRIDPGTAYRLFIAGTGATPVLADAPEGPVALNDGADFVQFIKPLAGSHPSTPASKEGSRTGEATDVIRPKGDRS